MSTQPQLTFTRSFKTDDPNVHEMQLTFTKRDGTVGDILVPTLMRSSPHKILESLHAANADLPTDRKAALSLVSSVIFSEPEEGSALLTDKVGWSPNGEYVLRHKTYSSNKHPEVLHRQQFTDAGGEVMSGELEPWLEAISRLCEASSSALFALGVALAGPTLAFFPAGTGIIFNMNGDSGTGKTTALQIALSVWQAASATDLVSLDITPAGLEEAAADANDGFVGMDEFGAGINSASGLTKLIRALAFQTRDGKARTRSKKGAESVGHSTLRFRVAALTTSELPLKLMAGKRLPGEIARFIDVSVPGRIDGGIFDWLDADEDAAELIAEFQTAIAQNYGVLADEFLTKLVNEREKCSRFCARHKNNFVQELKEDVRFDPTQERYVEAFGIVYAALALGIALELLPFSAKTIKDSVMSVYAASELQQGRSTRITAAIKAVQRHIEDPKNCPSLPKGTRCPRGIWTFRRAGANREMVYLLPSKLASFLRSDTLAKAVEHQLLDQEVQLRSSKENPRRQVQIDGLVKATDRPRLIALDLEKLMAIE